MFSQWFEYGLLDFVGFKLYEEKFDSITAYHFEIPAEFRKALHVAFLEERLKEDKSDFNYYFGTFEGKAISTGIEAQKDLDELRSDLIAIKDPAKKVKARHINNKLLKVFFEIGYEKTVKDYYLRPLD